MLVSEAIALADIVIRLGDTVVNRLKIYDKDTITEEEFKELFELPDFNSFSKKATEEQENNND